MFPFRGIPRRESPRQPSAYPRTPFSNMPQTNTTKRGPICIWGHRVLIPILTLHHNLHRPRINPKPSVPQRLQHIFLSQSSRKYLAQSSLATEGDGGGDGTRRVRETKDARFATMPDLKYGAEDGEYEHGAGEEVHCNVAVHIVVRYDT